MICSVCGEERIPANLMRMSDGTAICPEDLYKKIDHDSKHTTVVPPPPSPPTQPTHGLGPVVNLFTPKRKKQKK